MTGQLWKARDVAEYLGLEIGTVLDRFEAGDLPGFRLYGRKGGPVRFRPADIDAWLESCRTIPVTQINGPATQHPTSRPPAPEVQSDAHRILRPLDAE